MCLPSSVFFWPLPRFRLPSLFTEPFFCFPARFVCFSCWGRWEVGLFFFFFLSLAYFAQNKDLQFNPLNYKWHNLILCSGWVKFQCVYVAYFFIHLCVDEYLVWFYFLDIGLMHRWWAHKCICVWYDDLGPFGYMPRNGIDGSCGTSFSNIRRSLHSDFHCGGTKLTFPPSV